MNRKLNHIVERYNSNNRTPVFVDLSNIAYRSLFVFTPDKFKTSQGIPNGHFFGICQIIKTLVSTGYEVYLCRDTKSTFRQELNEEYKANRHIEEGSVSIHKILEENIHLLISELVNVHVISNEGYEADDIMYSAAKICSEASIFCYILSTDKDLLQSLDYYISIAHKFTLKGPQEVVTTDSEYYKKNFGDVPSRVLPFYRAFKGDGSDNLEAPIKRFPKDLLLELVNEFANYVDEFGIEHSASKLADVLLNHKCSKGSHEKWLAEAKTRDSFTKLYNNYKIMRLFKVPVYEEVEELPHDAFYKIIQDYELWSYKKFVSEFNLKGE